MSRDRRDDHSGDCRAQAVVPGLYQLRIRLERPVALRVGALGTCTFPAGWYVYTGSARNGLHQRIRRHLRHKKRKHWHIDDLLAVTDGVEAFTMPGTSITECELHARLPSGEVIIAGFGSSDCTCASHLAWFRRKPELKLVEWARLADHASKGPEVRTIWYAQGATRQYDSGETFVFPRPRSLG